MIFSGCVIFPCFIQYLYVDLYIDLCGQLLYMDLCGQLLYIELCGQLLAILSKTETWVFLNIVCLCCSSSLSKLTFPHVQMPGHFLSLIKRVRKPLSLIYTLARIYGYRCALCGAGLTGPMKYKNV